MGRGEVEAGRAVTHREKVGAGGIMGERTMAIECRSPPSANDGFAWSHGGRSVGRVEYRMMKLS